MSLQHPTLLILQNKLLKSILIYYYYQILKFRITIKLKILTDL